MTIIFADNRRADSSFIESVWRAQSADAGAFTSTAAVHWELVVMWHQGQTQITARGPETKTSPADYPADAEWLGITFKLGTFMPHLPLTQLRDRRDADLPLAARHAFWLHGSLWEIPTYENVEVFINRLVRGDLLMYDSVVEEALHNSSPALSTRALQYRFQRATGLTQQAVRQIQRARQAARLLAADTPILDTAFRLGYYDQSHLTNALRRFLGTTPAQLTRHAVPG